MKTITSLGAGTIGSSWAAFYAAKGSEVRLYDVAADALARGHDQAGAHLDRMAELGVLAADVAADARRRITACPELAAALDGTDFVQESVLEDYATKADVYRQLEQFIGQDTIIASSSSGLLITRMQSVLQHPGRALIAHPFNPPHLIPLVELVPGEQTDPAVVIQVREFFEGLGKTPVVLRKEVPGHIANRLAAALWRESIDLVASGVASVEDVDKAVSAGLGLRWAIMGQHMIYHLGGGEKGYRYFIDHIGTAFEEYWRTMADWTEIPAAAKEQVIAGVADEVGTKSVSELAHYRDEKLAGLLQVLRD